MKPTVSETSSSRLVGQPHLAHQRIERHEERVRADRLFVRQPIEQRRLARVRVADERDGRHRLLLPPLAQLRPALADLIDLALNRLDAHADAPPVGLELRLARTARADAAAEPRERRAGSGQPRQQVFQLRQLHLPLAFARARAAREDVENELRAIDDLPLELSSSCRSCAGSELVVEDHDIHAGLGAGRARALATLPRADEGGRIGSAAAPAACAATTSRTGRVCEPRQLVERMIRIDPCRRGHEPDERRSLDARRRQRATISQRGILPYADSTAGRARRPSRDARSESDLRPDRRRVRYVDAVDEPDPMRVASA